MCVLYTYLYYYTLLPPFFTYPVLYSHFFISIFTLFTYIKYTPQKIMLCMF